MTPDELVVRKDGHAEVATVEETVETTSTTYARVVSASKEADTESADSQSGAEVGEFLEGWVEVPDNPASPSYVLVCEDCGREPNPGSDEPGPLRKENYCNMESNAEGLKRIHEALRPTHSPRVERRAA